MYKKAENGIRALKSKLSLERPYPRQKKKYIKVLSLSVNGDLQDLKPDDQNVCITREPKGKTESRNKLKQIVTSCDRLMFVSHRV